MSHDTLYIYIYMPYVRIGDIEGASEHVERVMCNRWVHRRQSLVDFTLSPEARGTNLIIISPIFSRTVFVYRRVYVLRRGKNTYVCANKCTCVGGR